jgi:hypothetical protein
MRNPQIRERLTVSLALLEDGTVFVTVSQADGAVESHAWHTWKRDAQSALVHAGTAATFAVEAWVSGGVIALAADAPLVGLVGG